jgi:hypothetical protein
LVGRRLCSQHPDGLYGDLLRRRALTDADAYSYSDGYSDGNSYGYGYGNGKSYRNA